MGQMVGQGSKNNYLYKTADNKRFFFVVGIILVAVISAGWWYVSGTREEPEARPSRPSAPAPLFTTESSRTITVKHLDRLQFFRLLEDSLKEQELFGTTKRIIVKIQMPDLPTGQAGGTERFATFADFVDFYRLSPPKNLAQFLGGPLMVFVYYGENGSRLGLAAKTSDSDRTMLSMFSWESSLALDFRSLFFGAQFGEITGEFEDRTYRNIDWRFLKSPRTENLGIGYMIFPARDVLVITTSKEALEKAIDKLFEAK